MQRRPVKVTLLLTSTLTIMAGATIAPSLPQIQHFFSNSANSEILTKLMLTFPALFIAIGGPPVGALIDRFGRLKILHSSLILYGFAGTAGFFLNSLESILFSRAFLGIAVAGVMTATITLIADYFQGTERNAFMGLQGAFVAIGGAVFIIAGGLLAEISWRMPFLVYFSAFFLFPAALFFLNEPHIEKENEISSSSKKIVYPKTIIVVIYMTALLGMMLFYIIPVQIPFYIKAHTSASNTMIGLAIACSTFSSAIVSLNYKRLKKRWTFSKIYSFSFLFLGLGFLIIFLGEVYSVLVVGLLIGGIGMGVLIPNSNLWIVHLSPETMRGRIVGGLTTAIFIGQFISPLVVEPVMVVTSDNAIYAFAGIGMLVIAVAYFISTKITNDSISVSS